MLLQSRFQRRCYPVNICRGDRSLDEAQIDSANAIVEKMFNLERPGEVNAT
jgi:hypothetical protein